MHTRHQVLLALAVILAAVVWAVTGASQGDPYRDVHQVLDEPERYTGAVSVPGRVVANSTTTDDGTIRFTLEDISGDLAHANRTIDVVYAGVLPDGFGPKKVVVSGALTSGPTGWTLLASDIKVGCSSKY